MIQTILTIVFVLIVAFLSYLKGNNDGYLIGYRKAFKDAEKIMSKLFDNKEEKNG